LAFGLIVNGFVNGRVRNQLRGPRSIAPQDELRHRLGGGGVQAGQDVAVGVEGECDGRVPEPLADDLGRHARRQRRTCVAVADVVQPDLGSPAARLCCSNQRVIRSGWIGAPSGQVNTSPESR
jgi:hypothetical protein